MINKISLNCSSFVAKQYGYGTGDDWSIRVNAVNAYYSPIDTFQERFEKLILNAKELGYHAIDIWTPGQLSWMWATDAHIKIASDLLSRHKVEVTSIGGAFGDTQEKFVSACELAVGVGTKLLSGTVPLLFTDRDFLVKNLCQYDLRLAIENHPEKLPAEMLDQIGDTTKGRIGTAVDTGWYATQGFNAAQAIRDLDQHVFHIHLKDVRTVGEHVNCGYGQGIVPLKGCIKALGEIGYTGDISIENHCFDHDPTDELKEALSMVKMWIQNNEDTNS
jgi:sugar phosphate isomerase/epimerase